MFRELNWGELIINTAHTVVIVHQQWCNMNCPEQREVASQLIPSCGDRYSLDLFVLVQMFVEPTAKSLWVVGPTDGICISKTTMSNSYATPPIVRYELLSLPPAHVAKSLVAGSSNC